jgi:hypothetical protein
MRRQRIFGFLLGKAQGKKPLRSVGRIISKRYIRKDVRLWIEFIRLRMGFSEDDNECSGPMGGRELFERLID